MFRAAFYPRLDAGGLELALQQALELLDVAFALGAAHLESRGDVLIVRRLQKAKRQIFQLPFHLPDAEPIGERRIDLARLDPQLAPLRRVGSLRCAFSAIARRASPPPGER